MTTTVIDEDMTPEQATTRPPADGWWRVDWPDGRRTYYRSRSDALELVEHLHRHLNVTGPTHTETL